MRLLYVLKGGRVSLQQIQRFKITISDFQCLAMCGHAERLDGALVVRPYLQC
jgi:hypothetical protein